MEGQEMRARLRKGFWKPEEDLILKKYVETHGEGNRTAVSNKSGLQRGAKSSRLRWKNYLRPNIKRGMMSEEEKDLIIRLHKLLGNRWSLIAGRLPGRTDNEVKNYWNTHLNKRVSRNQPMLVDSENKKICKPSLMGSHTVKEEESVEKTIAVGTKEEKRGSALGPWSESAQETSTIMQMNIHFQHNTQRSCTILTKYSCPYWTNCFYWMHLERVEKESCTNNNSRNLDQICACASSLPFSINLYVTRRYSRMDLTMMCFQTWWSIGIFHPQK